MNGLRSWNLKKLPPPTFKPGYWLMWCRVSRLICLPSTSTLRMVASEVWQKGKEGSAIHVFRNVFMWWDGICSPWTRAGKLFKLLRLIRLSKLLRLTNLSHIMEKIDRAYTISRSGLSLKSNRVSAIGKKTHCQLSPKKFNRSGKKKKWVISLMQMRMLSVFA